MDHREWVKATEGKEVCSLSDSLTFRGPPGSEQSKVRHKPWLSDLGSGPARGGTEAENCPTVPGLAPLMLEVGARALLSQCFNTRQPERGQTVEEVNQ